MRILSTLLCLFLLTSLSAQVEVNNGWLGRFGSRTKGNGDVITKARDIDGFTGIQTCCSMQVEIAEGNFGVKVEAESNLQEFIETEVSGDRLKVGYVDNANFKSTKPIKVYISLPRLEYLKATSSSDVIGTNTFHGDDLEVAVNSSAYARLTFEGKSVSTDASSSGKLEVSGRSDRIEANASSSGTVDAGKLKSSEGRANASSSGDVVLNLDKSLRAKASSSGSVQYYGNPSQVDSDTSSSGKVRKKN